MLQADGVAPQESQHVQAVRSVNKNHAPSSIAPAQPDDIYVDCHTDPETQKPVVLWDDILQAFDNAVQIRDKARVVPFLKGLDLRTLEPHRIAAVPNTVLDVVVSNPSVETKVASSLQEKEEEAKPVRDVVGSQSTPASSKSTVRRSPVYGLENTALDNYNHIDRLPSSQCATIGSCARRNPVWGLENTAMDNYSHIDNPAFAPPPRGPQALLDNQTPTIKDLPMPPHLSNGRELSSRTPQSEGAATNASKDMDLAQLGIRASQGDKDAQVALGDMYKDGEGVQQDYQVAMDWYVKAADQGFVDAQFNIGMMYDEGKGVPQDFAKAMEWYLKAANQGYPIAQNEIGLMYDKGKGVPQDFAKAMEWFRMAANQGDADAQNNIGIMYDEGQGVPQNFAKAMEWFLKAANQAMDWFHEAAYQGDADAQNNLGLMFAYRQGLSKDYWGYDWQYHWGSERESELWFRKAADQRHPNARKWLAKLATSGSDKQIVTEKIKKKGFLIRGLHVRLSWTKALMPLSPQQVAKRGADEDLLLQAFSAFQAANQN
ncbi:HCP-like protein [Linnemannia elongata AG-77]|uniref:HCP-like protein n=1 Tax=Linnemannia elongata AG-77 TaxID=1314771 RepID=A0A197JF06_9FUNG|nr:HCP-like protein [Linnemannia elongata AG-77]